MFPGDFFCSLFGFQDRCLKPLGHPSRLEIIALLFGRPNRPVPRDIVPTFRTRHVIAALSKVINRTGALFQEVDVKSMMQGSRLV
jgi:hypothetical protein